MLDFESCQSLEKLVLDDEACGMALRLVRGVSQGASETSVETVALIEAVVDAGHFLSHPHTRKNFRDQLFIPGPVIDRGSHGAWEKRGSPSAFEAASARVEKILARGNPAPLAEDLQRELDRLISADARRAAVELPVQGTA
jgi:trimethylamine--corrinoid protein Co-methyltransferase